MKKNIHLLSVVLAILAITSACSEDYFDKEAYDNLISEAFPVSGVDTTQTWQTIGTVTGTLGVYKTAGETYQVKIFSGNPLSASAKVLASENVASGSTVTTSFSYPLADSILSVAFIDPKGYMSVMPAHITDHALTATFGDNGSTKSVASAVKKANDYVTIPTISYSSMESIGVNLQKKAVELTPEYATQSYKCPDVLKISSGTCNYSVPTLADESGRSLYVGKNVTWTLSEKQHIGKKGILFLDEGATLVIPDGITLTSDNSGFIIVMKGAKITGNEVIVANGNNDNECTYNAGTIDVNTFNNNGGYFYNANELITKSFWSTTDNGYNVNRGSITVNGDAKLVNSALLNACKFVCTGATTLAYLVNGDGSYLETKTLQPNGNNSTYGGKYFLYLGKNSIVNVLEEFDVKVGSIYIIGPYTYDTDQYAIFQCGSIPLNTNVSMQIQNSVYFCRKTIYYSDKYWSQEMMTERNLKLCFNYLYWWGNKYNGQAVQAAYGQVNFVKDEDECSPQYTPDEPSNPDWSSFAARFCFEDNFPAEGDYDFNDAVLTVTPTISGSTVTLKVSLDAVGALKQIASAIHVSGVNRSDVTSITRSGDFDRNNGRPASSEDVIKSTEDLLPSTMTTTTDMVINLFNDAHWSMMQKKNVETADVQRYFYNTVQRGNGYVGYQNDVNPVVVTYTIQLNSEEAAQKFVADNLDVFILEKYNGSYWEVHTFPYKTKQILSAYNNKDMTGYTNVFPWGVMVPGDFQYPIEWTKIGGITTNSVLEGAYQTNSHSFGQWAQDKKAATDWYNYPTSGMVYK